MPRKLTSKQYADVATGVRLSSHEKLCAERMKVLNDNINELRREVKCLRQDMSKGKGAISVLIFIGGILGVILGYFNWE